MPFSPAFADALAALFLSTEARQRAKDIHFRDAGHGYDPFGMHPSFVALGELIVSPLYDKYFRCKSWGHENIPATGPAIPRTAFGRAWAGRWEVKGKNKRAEEEKGFPRDLQRVS